MFVYSDVTGKMLLVNTPKGTQEIAQSGPHPFGGVGMNLSNAVAIIVTRPFMDAMIDGDMLARNVVVSTPLVGVDPRGRGSEVGNVALQRFAIGVFDHPQAHLPALPPNRADHRRALLVIGPVPPLFVRPTARGVVWIRVFVPFFPPHSATVHRSQSRDPAAALLMAAFAQWFAWPGATSALCHTATQSRAKLAVDSPLHIPRNTNPAGAGRSCLWAHTVP